MNLVSNAVYNPAPITARYGASKKTGAVNKSDSFKIRSQAAQLIEEELLTRAYAITKKEGGGVVGVPVADVIYDKNDPQKGKKYETCLNTLKEALLSLSRRSDAAANIIRKFLTVKQCKFFIVEPDDMSVFGRDKNTVAALYYPPIKSIIIPTSTLLGEDYNPRDFQDLLLHELIHAIDDLLVLDTDPKNPALYSRDIIKQQLKTFFSVELDKNRKILEELRAARMNRLKKQTKLNNPAAARKEINMAIDQSFAERPPHRIHIHDAGETDIVTKNTWFWYQTTDEHIVAPFVKYANDNLNPDSAKDSVILALEYMAHAVTFYLSADPAKRQRLRQFAPDAYNYIETTLLPLINK